jgi:hypothetical protein
MEPIEPGPPPEIDPTGTDGGLTRARKRLEDASARVTAEARLESREQVRELMGWA